VTTPPAKKGRHGGYWSKQSGYFLGLLRLAKEKTNELAAGDRIFDLPFETLGGIVLPSSGKQNNAQDSGNRAWLPGSRRDWRPMNYSSLLIDKP
jgi:hypothetical protein